jgi:hypothetical protein
MALKLTKQTKIGLNAVDAYHRVENVSLQNKNVILFNVRSYVDQAFPSFDEKQFSCDYDINGENPIKQAYFHLKTLPEFADAVDC